ncbi:MAG: hypothetical protein NVS3B20_19770 [Polyangiales bacterium]
MVAFNQCLRRKVPIGDAVGTACLLGIVGLAAGPTGSSGWKVVTGMKASAAVESVDKGEVVASATRDLSESGGRGSRVSSERGTSAETVVNPLSAVLEKGSDGKFKLQK